MNRVYEKINFYLPVFKRISKDSIDLAKNIIELLFLANPSFDYSVYEFVSFDISANPNGLEILEPNSGGVTLSPWQRTLMSEQKPKTYIYIEHIKVWLPASKIYKMLKDFTFVIK